jgi:hypothetical protein
VLYRLGRVGLLVVDDWAMAPLTENERRGFLEICDQRYHPADQPVASGELARPDRESYHRRFHPRRLGP